MCAFSCCCSVFMASPPLSLSAVPSPSSQVSFLRLCDHVYTIADNSIVGFGRQHQHGQLEKQEGGVAEESKSQRETINKALEDVRASICSCVHGLSLFLAPCCQSETAAAPSACVMAGKQKLPPASRRHIPEWPSYGFSLPPTGATSAPLTALPYLRTPYSPPLVRHRYQHPTPATPVFVSMSRV